MPEPGLSGTTGVGVIMNMPVSVCHQVSMIGQRSLPMTRWYHFHASGLIGSPTVPEQAQGREVVLGGPGLAEAHQPADGGRGGVQDGDPVALDALPPAVGVRVGGPALEHERGGPVEQRPIDDVRVAGDPARVGGAPPAVLVLDVEDVLERGVDADHVAAVGVQDGLGLAGGAGGVEDVERVFGVHHLGGAFAVGDGQALRSWYQWSRPASMGTSWPVRWTTITFSTEGQRLSASSTVRLSSTILPFL